MIQKLEKIQFQVLLGYRTFINCLFPENYKLPTNGRIFRYSPYFSSQKLLTKFKLKCIFISKCVKSTDILTSLRIVEISNGSPMSCPANRVQYARSESIFSLQQKNILKHSGDKNKEINHLGDACIGQEYPTKLSILLIRDTFAKYSLIMNGLQCCLNQYTLKSPTTLHAEASDVRKKELNAP